jgi:hypothetical protein
LFTVVTRQLLFFCLEIEAVFQGIFSIIYTLSDEIGDTSTIIQSIVAAISSNTEVKTKARLNLMVALFNIIFAGSSKCDVLNGREILSFLFLFLISYVLWLLFLGILLYAVATKQTQLVTHFFDKVDHWFSSWDLPLDCTRTVLKNFSSVLALEQDRTNYVKAQIKYFQTFNQSANSQYGAEVEQMITTAALNAISSPVDAFAERSELLEVFLFFYSSDSPVSYFFISFSVFEYPEFVSCSEAYCGVTNNYL